MTPGPAPFGGTGSLGVVSSFDGAEAMIDGYGIPFSNDSAGMALVFRGPNGLRTGHAIVKVVALDCYDRARSVRTCGVVFMSKLSESVPAMAVGDSVEMRGMT